MMRRNPECWDLHLHLGVARDGASLTQGEIKKAMNQYSIRRAVLFGIDEPDAGPTYEKTNNRVLKACSSHRNLIPFCRLNPAAGVKSVAEFQRCLKAGARGVKLHPRSEKFSPMQAEPLIAEIEKERLPIVLHTSHESNCRPLSWEKIFRRHRRIPFVLFHGGKDAFEEAISVARRNRNLWLETSTLSYWRSGLIIRKLGSARVVFGSDLPYSHPGVERLKLDLLLGGRDRRKVYSGNAKQILGE